MVEDEELTAVLQAVGPRLRATRLQRGTTLAEVSTATGISVSTLSRLESGQRRPTLELLLALSRAHRVNLDELVGAPATGDARVRPKPVKHRGMTYLPLSRQAAGGLQAVKMLIPPHWPAGEPEQQAHEGYEWFYVLSGTVRLLLGDHDLLLRPGEVAEFDTRTPHWFGNPSTEAAEALVLFGPQGERLHLRAAARRTPRP
ncbi:transcriptional regulator with XRE-family HTH domain [Motilibacter peucedani]|uniref:Transcriptional regulator with XRE-family HTH domain n=1 Tax=Motilibacter peucedani TaxID=598650 RepID=A0A420XS20_9ACTN|nr:XRE family transcriptional regulator [Motilibacter peucedani]RKS77609.1 transcriptional regulator with XRE-family HTH domain [Motilibacter peucedani]